MPTPVETYRADLLALCAAKDPDGPVLMLTLRPDNRFFWPCNMTFTQAQAVRMHRQLGQLLDNPESWIYVPEEQRQESKEL